MSITTYVFSVLSAVCALGVVLEMLRRRRMRERHAVWWLVGTIGAVILSVFPPVLGWLAHVLGVALPINLAFFLSIGILILVCIQHSSELTKVEAHTRALSERVVLQDIRIAELERRLAERDG